MQKHRLAVFGLALHVVIAVLINYLNINVSVGYKGLDDIFSIVSQKRIFSVGIFPLALFYLYKESNIAWWVMTIYSIIYILTAVLALGLAVVIYFEGTDSKNLIILLLVQITLVTFCIVQLTSKQARALCNKSYRECIKPAKQYL